MGLVPWMAAAAGFVSGWAVKSAVDRAVAMIAVRLLTSAVGQDKVAAALEKFGKRP